MTDHLNRTKTPDYSKVYPWYEQDLPDLEACLHKLPELVPQFKIETNPLSQILEFFQQRAQGEQGSLGAESPRDDTGQYSDGTTQE